MEIEHKGMKYNTPKVYVLNDPGIGVSEIAARICYDSFDKSEHDVIRNFNPTKFHMSGDDQLELIHKIEDSELLDKLAWVNFHHSILEHVNLSYYIEGTSRGVLQEHARHRIQSISVRSTRYTMFDIINAFLLYKKFNLSASWFIKEIEALDMFVTNDEGYNLYQIHDILQRLNYHFNCIGESEFFNLTIAPKNKERFLKTYSLEEATEILNEVKRRNVGDPFKHIVNDNWKVNIVSTFNLRSLKNYLGLRQSAGAWFQIKWLAKAIEEATPVKYLSLIHKEYKNAR